MPTHLTRRSFIKGTLAAAGLAATAGATLPQAVSASSGQELATLLDLSKCIGCGACVEACREVNAKYMRDPVKPIPKMFPERVAIEDWSDKKEVNDRLTPYNWLYIQKLTVEQDGRELEVNVPRRCMHCQNPPCANLCPWGAATKQKNGLTNIDPDICLGGAKCQQVCPWSIPQRQSGTGLYLDLMPKYGGNGVMFKCNRCHERLAKGELPACIEACPNNVQTIGPREEILAKAHALAKEMKGFIYGEHENGGTNTIYVSPVPFALLDRAIDQEVKVAAEEEAKKAAKPGPQADSAKLIKSLMAKKRQGRPHLKPAANSMASAENLTLALVVAPIAGVAAGIHRARRFWRNLMHTEPTIREDIQNGK